MIYPESFCTNGLYLNKFRRGAFTSERPVQPYFFTYEWHTTSPAYDCAKGLYYGILLCCEFGFKEARADYFPVFVPNEYLFTEYRKTIPDGDKLERWEVYAHAVRDFLSEEGGFGLCD